MHVSGSAIASGMYISEWAILSCRFLESYGAEGNDCRSHVHHRRQRPQIRRIEHLQH